jgi:hypothetical protein
MLTILQVAIGISFVFLLFSVIVSSANEIGQALASTRSKQLKAGIGELLQDREFAKAAKAFWDHPLISGLYKGKDGRPSYIAARTFVMTLLDLVRKGEIIAGNVSGTDLETQIAKIENEPLKRALTCLFEQAKKDVAKFEQALETWFNEAMDRVSGWYKRLTQYSLFLIGLVLAIWANVDTIHIVGALSTDPKLQADAADAAIAYLKTPSGAGKAKGSPANSDVSSTPTQEQKQNASPPDTPTPNSTETSSGTATPASSPTAVQSLETAATELASLQVPLGWAGPEYSYVGHHWLSAIAGWLLTALAASMGAPFWFDMLNRFINIRAAGRSPDEDPKGAKRKTK